ncbi:MAG: hypothetical protein SGILL_007778, partial [Bacillariaceae sp.]
MTHLQDVDAYLKDLVHQVETLEKEREQENHVPEKKVYRHSSNADPPAFQYFHMLPCYHQIGYYVQEAAERAKQRTKKHIKRQKIGVVTQDTGLEEKYEHQNYQFIEEDSITPGSALS